MKIIHIADLHLESKMESNLDREKALLRREELLGTFERVIEYAKANDIHIIMIAGDLFDKPNIRKVATRTVLELISENSQIDFLYLRGNHDCGDFDSEVDSGLSPSNLYTFNSVEWKSYSYDNIIITGREINDDNYKNLGVSLTLDPSKVNIVMLHGQESVYEGNDKTHKINLTELTNKFIDYLALGHIHSYKKERLDERGEYCYPGCLEGRGFDECGTKGFVVLDIEDSKISSEFISVSKRTLHEIGVKVEVDMRMADLLSAIEEALTDISEDDMVKVVLTGYTQMNQYIDLARINRAFESKYFLFKIYDHTQVRIDYESFLNDKTLKGTFVRLMQEEDIDESKKADIIEVGIKAIMGEEIDE